METITDGQALRQSIVDLIASVIPFDEEEQAHIQDTIDWINSGKEIYRIEKPATPPKHLVCYTVLFDPERQQMLLLEHRQSELLLPPGGHPEKGELPHETVSRELFEELGHDSAKIILTDGKSPFFVTQVETVGKTAGHIDVDLWYLVQANSSEAIKTDSEDFQREFGKHMWLSLDEILGMPIEKLDKNMHRFVLKVRGALAR